MISRTAKNVSIRRLASAESGDGLWRRTFLAPSNMGMEVLVCPLFPLKAVVLHADGGDPALASRNTVEDRQCARLLTANPADAFKVCRVFISGQHVKEIHPRWYSAVSQPKIQHSTVCSYFYNNCIFIAIMYYNIIFLTIFLQIWLEDWRLKQQTTFVN